MSQELNTFQDNYLRDEILQRLKEGESPFSVAMWVQQDLLEMTEIPPQELARDIKNYYVATVPINERMGLSKNRNAIKKTVERQRVQTSALEEMITLYLLQKGRIELGHREELFAAEIREKMRTSDNFKQELEEMFDDMGMEVDEKSKGKGKKGKKENPLDGSLVLSGTLDNTLETARRLLVDIHKMRQDLDLDPRQVEKVVVEDGVSPDYKVKRAKLAKKVFKTLVTSDGYDVEKVDNE